MTTHKRKDPCPCGSGRQYRRCCERPEQAMAYEAMDEALGRAHLALAAMEPQERAVRERLVQAFLLGPEDKVEWGRGEDAPRVRAAFDAYCAVDVPDAVGLCRATALLQIHHPDLTSGARRFLLQFSRSTLQPYRVRTVGAHDAHEVEDPWSGRCETILVPQGPRKLRRGDALALRLLPRPRAPRTAEPGWYRYPRVAAEEVIERWQAAVAEAVEEVGLEQISAVKRMAPVLHFLWCLVQARPEAPSRESRDQLPLADLAEYLLPQGNDYLSRRARREALFFGQVAHAGREVPVGARKQTEVPCVAGRRQGDCPGRVEVGNLELRPSGPAEGVERPADLPPGPIFTYSCPECGLEGLVGNVLGFACAAPPPAGALRWQVSARSHAALLRLTALTPDALDLVLAANRNEFGGPVIRGTRMQFVRLLGCLAKSTLKTRSEAASSQRRRFWSEVRRVLERPQEALRGELAADYLAHVFWHRSADPARPALALDGESLTLEVDQSGVASPLRARLVVPAGIDLEVFHAVLHAAAGFPGGASRSFQRQDGASVVGLEQERATRLGACLVGAGDVLLHRVQGVGELCHRVTLVGRGARPSGEGALCLRDAGPVPGSTPAVPAEVDENRIRSRLRHLEETLRHLAKTPEEVRHAGRERGMAAGGADS